ncbi:MAG: hypothetical protein AMXMBFR84_45920 [Candidatus Hydrogenedentota bacterium]
MPRFKPFGFAVMAGMIATGCATTDDPDHTGGLAPYGGNAHTIPGLIEAEHYDEGAPGVAYFDVDAENQGVAYRGETQVDIEQRPDASNGHGIGWTRTGEWFVYTVHVEQSGTYAIEFPVASNKKGGQFHLEVGGKDVTGPIDVPDTGGWNKLQMIRAENVVLRKGTYVMKAVMDQQGPSGSIADIDYMKFILVE